MVKRNGSGRRLRVSADGVGVADREVSLAARVGVTKKYAQAYVRALKKRKGQILDTEL